MTESDVWRNYWLVYSPKFRIESDKICEIVNLNSDRNRPNEHLNEGPSSDFYFLIHVFSPLQCIGIFQILERFLLRNFLLLVVRKKVVILVCEFCLIKLFFIR